MEIKRQYWIIGGGLGLSTGLWLMSGLAHTVIQVGELGLSAGALLWGLWWLQSRSGSKIGSIPDGVALPDRQAVEQALARVQSLLDQLQVEIQSNTPASPTASQPLKQLQHQWHRLTWQADRPHLKVAIVGSSQTDLTPLVQALKTYGETHNRLLEVADLTWSQELEPEQMPETGFNPALAHDILLFLTSGDLTESDFSRLQSLQSQSPLLVLLTQADRHQPGRQAMVQELLHQRLVGIVPAQHILTINPTPAPILVRREQADGSWQQWQEQPPADFSSLQQALDHLWATPEARQQLVWTTTHRQAQHLQNSIHHILNQLRRDQATALIEKSQWIAAGAAFVNPVPSLDLLATVAISGQLIWELAKLYRQPFSWDQGQEVAKTVAEQVVKLGLVEVSTQALSSLFKASGLAFLAGAGLQGVSAAYLTRMTGLSLVEYFEALDPLAPESSLGFDRLKAILPKVFAAHQRVDVLKDLALQTWEKLKVQSPQASQLPST